MKPTDSELAILHVLWEQGPSTVRQVFEHLSRGRDLGYTTALKLMQIMHEKGLITRTEAGRSHVYAALLTETDAQRDLLNRFVDTAFRGSAMKLVMQALGDSKASKDELDEIRRLLDQLDQR
ncbi:MAG: BlaI/MecI/CopY family transcriptional regulator [Sphingobacteriaceae bacterium]|nr:BlaI/MecI/CopY family transcriptional regulator [Cytophagaceae bacterium]